MVDTNENGEASKLSLSPEKDAAQSVLISATTLSTSVKYSEQTVVASESTHTMGEEEEEEEREEEQEDEDEEDLDETDEDEEDQAEKDEEQEKEEVNDEGRAEVNDEGREVVNVNNDDEGNKQEKAVMENENEQENAVVEKENGEKDAVKDDAIRVENEDKTEEPKTGAELGESSKGKGRKPRKRIRKKKVEQKATETVTVDGDKPESSRKEKDSKRVASMGMVFMCSSKTKADCFRYKILGLPESKKDQVAKIYKGMRLFLFDVDLRLMYGIFKAAGPGGYNIEPKAFKSAFPSQVRFTVIDDCLPLAEEKFKEVIKENYYSRNKFESKLDAEQVKKLCKLFVVPGKGGPSPKNAKKRRRTGAADEIRRPRPDAPRRPRPDAPRRARPDAPRRARPDARASGDRKRRAREEDRHPRPPSGREQRRRYNDYEQPPVIYEREPYSSLVAPVPRYLPAMAPPGRSYGYERALDPILEPRTYRVLDIEPRRHDDIVSLDRERDRDRARDRDRYHLYSREAPSYRDPVYSTTGQAAEYHHPPEPALLPEYRLVSREYQPPPAVQPAEYRLSGGRQVPPSYRDVGLTTEYRSYAAASPPESRRPRTHYRY